MQTLQAAECRGEKLAKVAVNAVNDTYIIIDGHECFWQKKKQKVASCVHKSILNDPRIPTPYPGVSVKH